MSLSLDPPRVKFLILVLIVVPGVDLAGVQMIVLQQVPSPRTTLVTMRMSLPLALKAVRTAAMVRDSGDAAREDPVDAGAVSDRSWLPGRVACGPLAGVDCPSQAAAAKAASATAAAITAGRRERRRAALVRAGPGLASR